MTTQTEALKLALEALYFLPALSPAQNELQDGAIEAIKKALAQPEQEPVAKYIGECSEGSLVQLYEDVEKGAEFYTTEPQRTDEEEYLSKAYRLADELRCHLAIAPAPQRTWVGLTDGEFMYFCSYVRADVLSEIETKLKELNT